jgi:hypothetical protein
MYLHLSDILILARWNIEAERRTTTFSVHFSFINKSHYLNSTS